MALIMVDIDHFKLFNDHYGHQAGDACLQQVGAAMRRAAMRPQDMVARYGVARATDRTRPGPSARRIRPTCKSS